ncbi:hypothetical protein PsorP6_004833 [Peronosclerospora sorghi]|uniref:Uncharacterized protein n=1 Tax=Peronosclerospora sorghi TaxID=230839 RepID=A0ACC0VMZ9_9STRA|nr:hypothetical protein PsorP6_004833 [Peronosclerospora sorghi]
MYVPSSHFNNNLNFFVSFTHFLPRKVRACMHRVILCTANDISWLKHERIKPVSLHLRDTDELTSPNSPTNSAVDKMETFEDEELSFES